MNLTETVFWEEYWRNCLLPSEVNYQIPFDRCLADSLYKRLDGIKGDAFEVGCAPGKWLAFLAKNFDMNVNGIEYSKAGMQATRRNFEILNLPIDTILSGDFFVIKPEPRFDLVMSFGFIEHFEDPDAVVARHAEWLKPGGMLIIGVPNFNGIYKPIQTILDKSILLKHNLKTMRLDYFRGVAQRLQLEIESLEYIASFEPSLPISRPGFNNLAEFFVKAFLRITSFIRRSPILDKFNSSLFSSCILAIYRKPLD
jgi:SAM-dependent methyltransferase